MGTMNMNLEVMVVCTMRYLGFLIYVSTVVNGGMIAQSV
jgi:hypothetical protein